MKINYPEKTLINFLPIAAIGLYMLMITACADSEPKYRERFPIGYILRAAHKKIDHLKLDRRLDFNWYKRVDSAFMLRWFKPSQVSQMYAAKAGVNLSDNWYFVDWRQLDDKIVFSILQDKRNGFAGLYYVTYDTLTRVVESADYITAAGSDGNYYKEDLINWDDPYTIELISVETHTDALNDSLHVLRFDSTVTLFQFTNKPVKGVDLFRRSTADTTQILRGGG